MYSSPNKKSNEINFKMEHELDSSAYLTPIDMNKIYDNYYDYDEKHNYNTNTHHTTTGNSIEHISEEYKIPILNFPDETRDEYNTTYKGKNTMFSCTLKKQRHNNRLDHIRTFDGINSIKLDLRQEFLDVFSVSPSTTSSSIDEQEMNVSTPPQSIEFNTILSENDFITPKSGYTNVHNAPLNKNKYEKTLNKSLFLDKNGSIPDDLFLPIL